MKHDLIVKLNHCLVNPKRELKRNAQGFEDVGKKVTSDNVSPSQTLCVSWSEERDDAPDGKNEIRIFVHLAKSTMDFFLQFIGHR